MRAVALVSSLLFLLMAALVARPAHALPIEACLGASGAPSCESSSLAVVPLSQTTTVTQTDTTSFSTELVARMLNGPVLSDQTLSVAFGDPAFLALIAADQNLLTLAGAASFQGPTLASDTTSHVFTSITQVTTNTSQLTSTHVFSGPDPAIIGDLGTCQTVGIDRSNPRASGCDGNFAVFALVAGHFDTDTLTITLVETLFTTTIHDHPFVIQEYNLTGIPAVASVPEPSSLLLFATMLLGFGFFGRMRPRTGR